ncbi:MAG: (2Fe-2S) ferredoxin domain-containing protein [Clostridia bacterium]|nr:(2Fe-2S) ferredoxin domain-containing protein [Clostridia bacterium]
MVKVEVCVGSYCHLNGANNVVVSFQHMIERFGLHEQIELSAAFCMKNCAGGGVSVRVNGEKYSIRSEEARTFFKEKILPLVQK